RVLVRVIEAGGSADGDYIGIGIAKRLPDAHAHIADIGAAGSSLELTVDFSERVACNGIVFWTSSSHRIDATRNILALVSGFALHFEILFGCVTRFNRHCGHIVSPLALILEQLDYKQCILFGNIMPRVEARRALFGAWRVCQCAASWAIVEKHLIGML